MSTQHDQREGELYEAARRFGEAWAHGDAETLDGLLSPTYTHSDAYGGFQDRAAWLDYTRRRKGRDTRIGFRDVRMRIVGDTAIITGINDLTAVDREGMENLSIRFTQVWVWRDGRWLREAFQATVTDPKSGTRRGSKDAQ